MEINWNDAPEWADSVRKTVVGNFYWCNDKQCLIFGYSKDSNPTSIVNEGQKGILRYFTINDLALVELRPGAWQEGEERMDNIGQNGNDGHYTVNIEPIDILNDDAGDINISETARLQGDAVLNDPIISAIIGKPESPVTTEHDNKNKYSRKIKTIVIDGVVHDIYVDVYDVLTAFNVINPATAHAVKKELMPGKRGAKGVIQDLTEARDSLNRAIELEKSK